MKRDVKEYQKKAAADGMPKLRHKARKFCLVSLAVGMLMSAAVLGGCASSVRQQTGQPEGYRKAQEALQPEEAGKNSYRTAGKTDGVAVSGVAGDGEIFADNESQAPALEAAESTETANQEQEDTENTELIESAAADAEQPAQASGAGSADTEKPAETTVQPGASGSLQILEGTKPAADEVVKNEAGGQDSQEQPEKEPLTVNVTMKAPDDAHSGPGYQKANEELKGVWISYLEWNTLPKEQQAFQAAVNQMFDNCVNLGMNAVFVHVRPDADSMYPSAYFPWSKFASGKQGVNPGYDPLAYMIDAAHSRGLKFHAWFNPYRVTGYLNGWDDLADSNPAKLWLTDSDTSNDRWVLLHDVYYYFNPSVPQVRELIINGVKEVVANYNVDGIHFDDYFYPTLNNADPARYFDKPEYDASGSSLDITNWRRDNVNQLVKGVYAAVKELKPAVEFGVSPAGYVANLRSDAKLFVDIDTWMSQPGYVDYIMPQLYWGFEAKVSGGTPAPYAFENNLNTWIELKNRGNVTLYLGLAMSRAGTNVADNNEVSEWQRNSDIIKRQTEAARNSGQVSGVCYFSYSSFFEAAAQQEVANLLPALKN